jgi:protein tyrosine phosphatase
MSEANICWIMQGPLSCTINDFWQMVFEQKSNIILMLTEFEEMTVTRAYIAKSERYMPETADEVVPYGNYLVQLLSKVCSLLVAVPPLHLQIVASKAPVCSRS